MGGDTSGDWEWGLVWGGWWTMLEVDLHDYSICTVTIPHYMSVAPWCGVDHCTKYRDTDTVPWPVCDVEHIRTYIHTYCRNGTQSQLECLSVLVSSVFCHDCVSAGILSL